MIPTRPRRGQRPVGQNGLQVAALDQPHGHIQPPLDLTEVIDRHHMRLVELCGGVGLPAEPLLKDRIIGEIRGQHLQCHDPVDRGVICAPDFAHAAATQQLHQPVAAERRPVHLSLPVNCG